MEGEEKSMRMLCVDDEPLMLIMLEKAVREAAPDADIHAFRYQEELLEDELEPEEEGELVDLPEEAKT